MDTVMSPLIAPIDHNRILLQILIAQKCQKSPDHVIHLGNA